METSSILSISAILISFCAFLISFLTFRREKNKSNQDLLFSEKIVAYKDLTGKAYKIIDSYFDLLHKVQYENDEPKKWNKKFEKFCPEYYGDAHLMKDLLYTNIAIIPSHLFEKFEGFVNSSLLFVTSSAHGDSELMINNFDKLEDLFTILIDESRKDLNVDSLNIKLLNRTK